MPSIPLVGIPLVGVRMESGDVRFGTARCPLPIQCLPKRAKTKTHFIHHVSHSVLSWMWDSILRSSYLAVGGTEETILFGRSKSNPG